MRAAGRGASLSIEPPASQAARVLQAVAIEPANEALLLTAGAIPPLLRVISPAGEVSSSANPVDAALRALRNIAALPLAKGPIVQQKGIEFVLFALTTHAAQQKVVEAAASLLWSLAHYGEERVHACVFRRAWKRAAATRPARSCLQMRSNTPTSRAPRTSLRPSPRRCDPSETKSPLFALSVVLCGLWPSQIRTLRAVCVRQRRHHLHRSLTLPCYCPR